MCFRRNVGNCGICFIPSLSNTGAAATTAIEVNQHKQEASSLDRIKMTENWLTFDPKMSKLMKIGQISFFRFFVFLVLRSFFWSSGYLFIWSSGFGLLYQLVSKLLSQNILLVSIIKYFSPDQTESTLINMNSFIRDGIHS